MYPTRRQASCITTTDSVPNTLALDPSVPIPVPFRSYQPSRSLNLYLKLSHANPTQAARARVGEQAQAPTARVTAVPTPAAQVAIPKPAASDCPVNLAIVG